MKNVLVTGGCGYCGSVLVPRLLNQHHAVTVVDLQWFGNLLEPHPALRVINADIKDYDDLEGFDALIHLAGIANDPCGELEPTLTWETNALGTLRLVEAAVRAGVKQFIYASSGSVYGVKGDRAVTETDTCVPITAYNKAKMVAERCLLSYCDKIAVQIVRPGTVCGVSPRQRLDISVNGMTVRAFHENQIVIQGKDLQRANVHIEDLTQVYIYLLDFPAVQGVFNAAFENATLGEIAGIVRSIIPEAEIIEIPIVDARSYRIDSSRLLHAGFHPTHTIENAVLDLVIACRRDGLENAGRHYNLRTMPR